MQGFPRVTIFARIGACEVEFIPRSCYIVKLIKCSFGNHHPLSERCEMPTQSLPAASLRSAIRLPAARVLFRVSNYLIYRALWATGTAVSGIESSFLPALREAPSRVPQLRSVELAGRRARRRLGLHPAAQTRTRLRVNCDPSSSNAGED